MTLRCLSGWIRRRPADLLAAVPYDLPSPVDQPPDVARTVGLWDVASTTRRATVTVRGTIVDMDLNARVLALLVGSPQGAERIVRYATNGVKLGSTPLAAPSVRRMSMGARVIAYAAGNRLVEMSAASGAARTLWTGSQKPRLVTVGGGRVFWTLGHRRVLAMPA